VLYCARGSFNGPADQLSVFSSSLSSQQARLERLELLASRYKERRSRDGSILVFLPIATHDLVLTVCITVPVSRSFACVDLAPGGDL
jgi:hypothetical protein